MISAAVWLSEVVRKSSGIELLLVFAGGCLGTALRAGLLALLPEQRIALAVINLVGCFAFGVINARLTPKQQFLRPFLLVGGVSGFTSWSALALQAVSTSFGVVLAVVETILGVLAAWLGHRLGTRAEVA